MFLFRLARMTQWAAVAAVLVLAVFACSLARAEATSGQGAGSLGTLLKHQGQQLAEERCGACHAVGAADASKNARALPLRTLFRSKDIEEVEEKLAMAVIGHKRAFPPFELSAVDTAKILEYVFSLKTAD